MRLTRVVVTADVDVAIEVVGAASRSARRRRHRNATNTASNDQQPAAGQGEQSTTSCQVNFLACGGIAEPLGWFCPDTCKPDNNGARFAGSVVNVFFARFHEILPPVNFCETTSPSTV